MIDRDRLYRVFGIPELDALAGCLDVIVTPAEQRLILDAARRGGELGGDELGELGGGAADALYRRGILDSASGDKGAPLRYKLGSFYTRLDVFVLSELELWRALPLEIRAALDRWYFDAYYARLAIDAAQPPTGDAVLTLDETLAFIERETRTPYLVNCDCRSLSREIWTAPCDKPLETCVTFRDGPNSSAHRGIARRISKAEACEVVRKADEAGLIHQVNDGTICNCCIDCCYLSRARSRRNRAIHFGENPAAAAWPRQTKRVALASALCADCGLCRERCPHGLFTERSDGGVAVEAARCIGCGLCVNTCAAGALTLARY